MMKKLAVTVFALSFTALGCGSDDGGKKDAAPKLDTPAGLEVQAQPDVAKMDTPLPGPEVQADKPINLDQAQGVEVQGVEVQAVEAGIDIGKPIDVQPRLDGGADAPVGIDGARLDTQKLDTTKPVDGGVDTGSVG